jgi:hypothetical protein
MMYRLGRDDELKYMPDNPRLLARPYVYAAGCSSVPTTRTRPRRRMRWNPADKRLFSEQMAYPPTLDSP